MTMLSHEYFSDQQRSNCFVIAKLFFLVFWLWRVRRILMKIPCVSVRWNLYHLLSAFSSMPYCQESNAELFPKISESKLYPAFVADLLQGIQYYFRAPTLIARAYDKASVTLPIYSTPI